MNIYAVIVTYRPGLKKLHDLCNSATSQGCCVILVDNSEEPFALVDLPGVEIIRMGYNAGIAKAQNDGIRKALERSAEIVLFFDQDSSIEPGFVRELIGDIPIERSLVVAPVFHDEQRGFEFPSFIFNRVGLAKAVYSEDRQEPYAVDLVISSGSAATAPVFRQAGLMDEDFFIDFVDLEWSWRCRSLGIPIYVVPKATMKHSIGLRSVNFLLFKGFIHSANRSYFKIRNSFLLFRKGLPRLFCIKEVVSGIVHQVILLLYVKRKADYFGALMSGIADGISGVAGNRPNQKLPGHA